MPNLDEFSAPYRCQLTYKALGRCPICGDKPSPRSPKGLYCEYHIEARAERERRRIKSKRRFPLKKTWLELDWSLGAKLIAKMMGVTKQTVYRHYRRLRALGKIKAIKGFILPVGRRKVA